MAIRATRSLAICKAKAVYVTSFLSHFKTMNVGPVPGIEPSTSRSAVKLSTDCANPAAVKNKITDGDPNGLLQISSDRDDRMAAKIKTKKITWASNKTQKPCWTKF